MIQSVRVHRVTRMQRLLDIPSHVQDIMDHGIHRGVVVTFVIAQLRTRVDLRVSTMLS